MIVVGILGTCITMLAAFALWCARERFDFALDMDDDDKV